MFDYSYEENPYNIVERGENVGYQHFPSSTMFSTLSVSDLIILATHILSSASTFIFGEV